MAGFFGMFDYSKEGPGVSKDAPKKKRFFEFFDLYFRKISKLVSVNLIYILFCLPAIILMLLLLPSQSVTMFITLPLFLIGPATAGLTYVVRNLTLERPVFMFSDFVDAMKDNFKQSFVYGIIFSIVLTLIALALVTYVGMLSQSIVYCFLFGLSLVALLVFSFMNCYIYLQIVTVNLKLTAIISNAFRFAVLGFKSNIFSVLFCAIIWGLCFWYFPFSLLFIIPFAFSTTTMIICYNSYQHLEKYIINPYYEQHPEEHPDYRPEEEEAIFSDEQLIPARSEDEE